MQVIQILVVCILHNLKTTQANAYQMMGEHNCELLDEDRVAALDDFVEEQGYEYYDMSREYEKTVRAC